MSKIVVVVPGGVSPHPPLPLSQTTHTIHPTPPRMTQSPALTGISAVAITKGLVTAGSRRNVVGLTWECGGVGGVAGEDERKQQTLFFPSPFFARASAKAHPSFDNEPLVHNHEQLGV